MASQTRHAVVNLQTEGSEPMAEFQQNLAAGQRRLTPAHLAAAEAAADFEDLGPEITRGTFLSAFKRAAPTLGINTRLVHFIDLLMSWSLAQDWEEGARPIVWPSNALLQEELQLSRTQVKALLRACIEQRLILPVDSPNGKRYGRRNERGRILEAYGFDLSLLAVRHEEFVMIAERARRDREARRLLRRQLTIARKAIAQLADTALEHGVDGMEWEAVASKARDQAVEARESSTIGTMERALAELTVLQGKAESIVSTDLLAKAFDPKSHEDRRDITATTQPPLDKSCTNVNALQKKHERGAGQGSTTDLPESAFEPKEMPIDQNSVINISPGIALYLGDGQASWPNIVAAAYHLRHDLGISQHAWGEACQKMGREYAAACVALIDAKKADVQSPGGYLRGMTMKFLQGELHLARSYYGLSRGTRACH